MKKNHLIVMSFDDVSSDDLDKMKELPNFSKIMSEGALIKNVETIYPSLTYPAHVTIVTGKYPCNHGIVSNTIFKVKDNNPNWNWYGTKIKGRTLFHLAKEKELTTCSIVWPVTGKLNIDYNMPEIFCTKPWHNQLLMSALAGTIKFQYELNNKFGYIRKGTSQPFLDDFVLESTKYTIEKYKPNVMFIHFIDVDAHRHKYGYDSNMAYEALKRHDKRLGEVLKSIKDAEIMDNTTIVALGDHSSLNVNKIIRLNKVFYEKGLITLTKNNRVKNYKAIAKSCDGSTYIYINDKKVKDLVYDIIDKIREYDNKAIEFVLNSTEARLKGADPNCDFMIEAGKGYYFIDEVQGELIENLTDNVCKTVHRYRATHGYSPTKENYKTFFMAWGNKIKNNIVLEEGKLINHGPTLAKIIGLELEEADGIIEDRILDI